MRRDAAADLGLSVESMPRVFPSTGFVRIMRFPQEFQGERASGDVPMNADNAAKTPRRRIDNNAPWDEARHP